MIPSEKIRDVSCCWIIFTIDSKYNRLKADANSLFHKQPELFRKARY
jgi:hypothetical protein